MKKIEKVQLGFIAGLILIIGIVLGALISGSDAKEISILTQQKSLLESEKKTQSKKIIDLGNDLERTRADVLEARKDSKKLKEIENFIPFGEERSVKELYEENQEQIKTEKESEQKKLQERKEEEARKRKEQEEAEKRESQKLGISYDELIYDISYLKEEYAPLSDGQPRYFLEDTESGVIIEIIGDKKNITSSTVIIPVADINSFGTIILYLKNLFPNERSIEIMTDLNEGLEKNGELYTTIYGDIKLKYKKNIAGLMLVVTSVNAE